jgi:hypothetical protein
MAFLSRLSRRPVAGVASLAGLLLVVSVGASAAQVGAAPTSQATCTNAPALSLANPSAGDVLLHGDYIVSGVARDPSFPDGEGVESVQLFLGQRDLGGIMLASATPEDGVFRATVEIPDSMNGGMDFVAYAQSSTSGLESRVSVPVHVGAAPTPTPRPEREVAQTPAPTATTLASCAPASETSPVVATAVAEIAATQAVAQFHLANPSNGDTLLSGDYMISGSAVDIDRVDVFLGSRDAGGFHLGSVTPENDRFQMEVDIPNRWSNHTDLYAYARSAINGQETVVSVPVFVGAPPTPTPRPSSSSGD